MFQCFLDSMGLLGFYESQTIPCNAPSNNQIFFVYFSGLAYNSPLFGVFVRVFLLLVFFFFCFVFVVVVYFVFCFFFAFVFCVCFCVCLFVCFFFFFFFCLFVCLFVCFFVLFCFFSGWGCLFFVCCLFCLKLRELSLPYHVIMLPLLSSRIIRSLCICPLWNFLDILTSISYSVVSNVKWVSLEPRHEKTCLRGLWPGNTQTGLLIHRS